MALGLANKFDILSASPYDSGCATPEEEPAQSSVEHWVPSRYNVRAIAEDGRLVLWNTLSGRLTAFEEQHRQAVIDLLKKKGFEAPQEGAVEYLAKRGYLVRKGVDEYRQFQRQFGEQHYRKDVLELILLPSEDCNFRCTYCYEDFARGTMLPEVREGIKNLVRKRAKKLDRLSIDWFGGEPLYGWEAIEDLGPFFMEIGKEYDIPVSGKMTTNGYLLTPEICDKLFEWNCRAFQITLDGLPEYHDKSRPARDGSPTFEVIFENLKAMAARQDPFKVVLRVNFDQTNIVGLPEFIEVLSQEFKHDPRFEFRLHPVGKWGGPNDAQLEVCGTKDSDALQREMTALAREKGLHFGKFQEISKLGGQVCYAARPFNLLIGATGKVMKCTIVLDKDDYNVVGHLKPDGELVIDDDRMALWTEPAYEQDSQCRKCVVLPTCQGIHCPMIRIEQDTQPCCPSRTNFKNEMLDTLKYTDGGGRSVQVSKNSSEQKAQPSDNPSIAASG